MPESKEFWDCSASKNSGNWEQIGHESRKTKVHAQNVEMAFVRVLKAQEVVTLQMNFLVLFLQNWSGPDSACSACGALLKMKLQEAREEKNRLKEVMIDLSIVH